MKQDKRIRSGVKSGAVKGGGGAMRSLSLREVPRVKSARAKAGQLFGSR